MTDTGSIRARIQRRETHSPRATLAIVIATILILVFAWLALELMLSLLHLPALLVAPTDMLTATARLATYPPAVVATAAVIVAVLGFWGMTRAASGDTELHSVANRIYYLRQLFSSSFSTSIGRANWQLDVARFAGEVAAPLARLLDRAAGLGDKLGPILVQLPPNLTVQPENLERTLRAFAPPDLPEGLRAWIGKAGPRWDLDGTLMKLRQGAFRSHSSCRQTRRFGNLRQPGSRDSFRPFHRTTSIGKSIGKYRASSSDTAAELPRRRSTLPRPAASPKIQPCPTSPRSTICTPSAMSWPTPRRARRAASSTSRTCAP